MPFTALKIGAKEVIFRKAIVNPNFQAPTVLVSDPWDYVEMWLKREGNKEALFYWQQARHFFSASVRLPKMASPLASYYCFLNAAKTLLTVKGTTLKDAHGVTGESTGTKAALSNETVKFQRSGVLSALCNYFGEPAQDEIHSIKDVFYNIPYIHRAYMLTFSSQPEMFFRIERPRYVRKASSNEAWFSAEIADIKLQNQHTINKLPGGFERDLGADEKWVIRRTKRFTWRLGQGEVNGNIARLARYHRSTRASIHYIHGPSRLWYFKRGGVKKGAISRTPITLAFAAMHRFSEIARYEPLLLARHFELQHNWLLSEFLTTAPYHFCDEIAAEITGQDFMMPGRKFIS